MALSGATLAKPTLAQAVYAELRRQILHAELGPGEFVSERGLAQRLEAGLAAVRAAVQRLAAEGLLTVQPRRGIMVTPQSVQDVVDLFEVRLLIEQRVVRNIAGVLSPAQLDALRDRLGQMKDSMIAGDPAGVVEHDFAFHRLMCEFSGNRHLTGCWNASWTGCTGKSGRPPPGCRG